MNQTENIKKLYAKLERTDVNNEFGLDEFSNVFQTDEEKSIFGKERLLLSSKFLYQGNISNSKEIIEYAESRIVVTSNAFLLSHYYHALYNLTRICLKMDKK